METINTVFYIVILLISVIIHEVAHGRVAYALGDDTAKYAGRLTLNPLKHIDPFGSVILPALLVISGAGFVIGWAKPVPYNPDNLSNKRWGSVLVASAGVLVNLLIAIVFSLAIRIASATGYANSDFLFITSTIVLTNLVLGIFNLIPVPPLDGARILFGILGYRARTAEAFLERYSIVFVILFIVFVWPILTPLFIGLFSALTGLPFGV